MQRTIVGTALIVSAFLVLQQKCTCRIVVVTQKQGFVEDIATLNSIKA